MPTYTVVLRKDEDGSYMVRVPSLPGCVTAGATVDEALAMARDLIPLWLEELSDRGLPIPSDKTRLYLNVGAADEVIVRKVAADPPSAQRRIAAVA
jgi:antitoxin HicB